MARAGEGTARSALGEVADAAAALGELADPEGSADLSDGDIITAVEVGGDVPLSTAMRRLSIPRWLLWATLKSCELELKQLARRFLAIQLDGPTVAYVVILSSPTELFARVPADVAKLWQTHDPDIIIPAAVNQRSTSYSCVVLIRPPWAPRGEKNWCASCGRRLDPAGHDCPAGGLPRE